MRFGVCVPHYRRPIDVNDLTGMAVQAEQMGFDSVWVTDHIIVPYVIPGRTDIVYRHDMLGPRSLLTHLGAVTNRVNVGTIVVILPYWNPIILAKAIATAGGWCSNWLGGPRWNRGGGSAPSARACGVYNGTWMTMKRDGAGEVTLNSYLRAGKMTVDRHPEASIYSHRPIGLGRDELKW